MIKIEDKYTDHLLLNNNIFKFLEYNLIQDNFVKYSVHKNTYGDKLFSSYKKFIKFDIFFSKIKIFKDKFIFKKNQFFKIKHIPTDFSKFLKTKNLLNFFIRKNKIFNKGRYSRNRQLYRTGVY